MLLSKVLFSSLGAPLGTERCCEISPEPSLLQVCPLISFVKWRIPENTRSEIPLPQQLLMPVLVPPLSVILLSEHSTLRVWALRLGLCWDRCSLKKCSSWLIPASGSVKMRMQEETEITPLLTAQRSGSHEPGLVS